MGSIISRPKNNSFQSVIPFPNGQNTNGSDYQTGKRGGLSIYKSLKSNKTTPLPVDDTVIITNTTISNSNDLKEKEFVQIADAYEQRISEDDEESIRSKESESASTILDITNFKKRAAKEAEMMKANQEIATGTLNFDFLQTESQLRLGSMVGCEMQCAKITDFLFVSGHLVASDWNIISSNGITRIVNCSAAVVENYFEDKPEMEYLTLSMIDGRQDDILWFFCQVVKFIEEGRREGKKTLVHCEKGISRSCSFVISFLVWAKNISWKSGFNEVKRIREICSPNTAFTCNLIEIDDLLRGDKQTSSLILRCAYHLPHDPKTAVLKLCLKPGTRNLLLPSTSLLNSKGLFVMRYVIDFVHHVYVWIGREVSSETTEKAMDCCIYMKHILLKTDKFHIIHQGHETLELMNLLVQDGEFTSSVGCSTSPQTNSKSIQFDDLYDLRPASADEHFYKLSSLQPADLSRATIASPRVLSDMSNLYRDSSYGNEDSPDIAMTSGNISDLSSNATPRTIDKQDTEIETKAIYLANENLRTKALPTLQLDGISSTSIDVGGKTAGNSVDASFKLAIPQSKKDATRSTAVRNLLKDAESDSEKNHPNSARSKDSSKRDEVLNTQRSHQGDSEDNCSGELTARSLESHTQMSDEYRPLITSTDPSSFVPKTRNLASEHSNSTADTFVQEYGRSMSPSTRTDQTEALNSESALPFHNGNVITTPKSKPFVPKDLTLLGSRASNGSKTSLTPGRLSIPSANSLSLQYAVKLSSSKTDLKLPEDVSLSRGPTSVEDLGAALFENDLETMSTPSRQSSISHLSYHSVVPIEKPLLFHPVSVQSKRSSKERHEWQSLGIYDDEDLDEESIFLLLSRSEPHYLWVGSNVSYSSYGIRTLVNEEPELKNLLKWIASVKSGEVPNRKLVGKTVLSPGYIQIVHSGDENEDFWSNFSAGF